MADRNYEPTQAQETMKREMSEPRKLGEVLDETLGSATGPHEHSELSAYGAFQHEVPTVALEIINEQPSLSMSMKQWQVVQNMVEEGIRRGYQLGQGQ